MDAKKLNEIFDDQWWESACKLYGVPESKTKNDYLALCSEIGGFIYTPTIEKSIELGIFTKRSESLPNQPTPTEILQEENRLLRAQITAESDRTDFIEDCIAEMAAQVYL